MTLPKVRLFDRQYADSVPCDGLEVAGSSHALEVLQRLAQRTPPGYFVEMETELGPSLLIGLGANLSAVQFTTAGEEYQNFVVAFGSAADGEFVEFLMNDTPTPVRRRNCVSSKVLADVVEYFILHSGMKPDLDWEEV